MVGQLSRRRALIVVAALLIAGAADAQQADKPAQPAKAAQKTGAAPAAPVLEPRAVDIVKAASARLAAARTMSFTALASY
ncbi:MAG: hypothetical protein ABWY07_03915, partial [Burkholderiales bacterium]